MAKRARSLKATDSSDPAASGPRQGSLFPDETTSPEVPPPAPGNLVAPGNLDAPANLDAPVSAEVAAIDPALSRAVPVASGTAAANTTPTAMRTPGAWAAREGETAYLIDAPSLIFQVFHGIPPMTSPQGEPVNAVYGFLRDIHWFLKQRATYVICAFDTHAPTFRNVMYDEYKAHREEMPVDLVPQMDAIRELLRAFGVPVLELDGYEADDILATLAREAEARDIHVRLVSSDKDLRQLLTDKVQIYYVRKNLLYDQAALLAEWGVRPDQVVDFQALVGDSVDNVPGVPLIGPKAAQQLLTQYQTLDNVLEHAAEVQGAKRSQNLQTYREQALLSRELVRLRNDVPLNFDWESARATNLKPLALVELLPRFGFRSLLEDFRRMATNTDAAMIASGATVEAVPITSTTGTATTGATRSATTAAAAVPFVEKPWNATYRTIATPEAFAAFLADLKQQSVFSFDTETTSVTARHAELVGCSFAWKAGEGYYLPVRAPEGEPRLDLQPMLDALKPILEDPRIKKVGQNLKYDLVVMRNVNILMQGIAFDTMLASYLLEAGERNHNLDELSQRRLGHTMIPIRDLIGTGKNQKTMDQVPVPQITDYAAEDADAAWRLVEVLGRELQDEQLQGLFDTLEVPLIDVLVAMEYAGIRVDPERLAVLSAQYGEVLKNLEGEIYKLAGHEFNINSPKQLQQILFTELKLPILKKTKTGPSTDADVLEELAWRHPLPAKIVEYRQYAKLKGTYLDTLPKLIFPPTGRVHASFNQHIAATGRLSSSDPNLQNIPVRTEQGREMRSAFLPAPGWVFLTADYSQIELRILAHFCQDPALCAAFAADQDIHALVASQVHNVGLEQVTKQQRYEAKAVNFGIIYGQSPHGLAKQLGIEVAVAEDFISQYFRRYPGVEKFLSKVLVDAREKGYVSTLLGRKRKIAGIRGANLRHLNMSERAAVNAVVQGTAADLIKQAMLFLYRRLQRENFQARLLLQIHDELVFEVPPEELSSLAKAVVEEMTTVMTLTVPLKVDLNVGSNWLEVVPFLLPASR